HRTRPRATLAPALRPIHQPERLFAADRALRQMGAGICRLFGRPGRRAPAGDATFAAVGIHYTGARAFRGGGARWRGASACHLVEYSAVRSRHRRAFPRADAGPFPGRSASPRTPQNRRQHLALGCLRARQNVTTRLQRAELTEMSGEIRIIHNDSMFREGPWEPVSGAYVTCG